MSWADKIRRFFSSPAPRTAPPPRVFSNVSWQDRVRQVQLPPDQRFSVESLAGPQRREPARQTDEEQIIKDALLRSGFSAARDEDIDFYRRALDAGKLNFRDVRKIGKPISSDEKRAMGITYRGVLAREFLNTLNEKGLADPATAAQMIAQPAFSMISSARSIRSTRAAGIDLVKFRFGKMVAGHCSYSRKMDGKRVGIGKAEPLPATSCEHPDQCGCRWQAWLPIMDELD